MKRIIAITAFDYFSSGALTLLIPLLLLDRHLNVADIGIVLSTMPLVFLVARLLFAAFADQIGWAHVFVLLNWPATFFSSLIYYFAKSIPIFSVGKIVEGLRDSAYWAVNRTAIFSLSPHSKEKEATRINAVIWIATAVGSGVAGIGIAFLGFSTTLAILIVASSMMGIPALMLWKTKSVNSQQKALAASAISSLNPRGRDRGFWGVSIALFFYSLATYPLVTLLLPVFMQQRLGYSYLTIGVAFLAYNLVAALVTLGALRKRLGIKRVIVQSAIGLFATFLLASSGSGFYFLALFIALAVTRGLGIGFFESIIVKATKNKPAVSVDIGWLHAPTRLAEFASVLYAGFIAQSLGYIPVFATSGIFFAIFSATSLYILKN
jgi:hypothetical protein